MSKTLKIFFPVGIFIVLFILFFSMGSGISGYYYYDHARSFIEKTEKDSFESSVAIIDACSIIAELSEGKDQKKRLTEFFSGAPQKNLYTKAFYALGNGSIIAHSNPEEITELDGNLASDEFKYNVDQIFYPLTQKEKKIFFVDYYIHEEKIPFSNNETRYLKKYLYKNIDRNSWLVSKAVEKKVKAGKKTYKIEKVGTVNIILSKKPIYDEILKIKDRLLHVLIYYTAASFILSFLISLAIFARYNSIRKKAVAVTSVPEIQDNYADSYDIPENTNDLLIDSDDFDIITEEQLPEIFDEDTGEKVSINPKEFLHGSKYTEFSQNSMQSSIKAYSESKAPIQIVYDESPVNDANEIVILDAVPIKKRRIS